MMGIASCNAERWLAHRSAQNFVGVTIGAQNRIEYHMREGDTGVSVRQQRAGDVWGWRYASTQPAPSVWCGLDSGGALILVWEGDEAYDPVWAESNPIYTVNAVGKAALAGGNYVKAIMPDEAILEELQADIDAATLPAWISGSGWENYFDEASYLQSQLFLEGQAEEGFRYGRWTAYTEYINRSDVGYGEKRGLTLYWLRAASQVLMDHRYPSIIPLALDRFSVSANGEISLAA